jgi:hypothetical protein
MCAGQHLRISSSIFGPLLANFALLLLKRCEMTWRGLCHRGSYEDVARLHTQAARANLTNWFQYG